jgi:hypothetical protein
MRQDIRIINLGGVNCCLVNTDRGFILIAMRRRKISAGRGRFNRPPWAFQVVHSC